MTSVIELDGTGGSAGRRVCHVCVVGAGAAGLYLAKRLSGHGLSVTVLEAGGRTCLPDVSVGLDSTFDGLPYRAATEGRAFGLGGSTSRWGGLLVPHSDLDILRGEDRWSDTWRHVVAVVKDKSQVVLEMLGLRGEADFMTLPAWLLGGADRVLRDHAFCPIAAEFMPFTRRNLSHLLRGTGRGKVEVFLHAVACTWRVRAGRSGDVTEVIAASPGGRQVKIAANAFVIAAGTLESTRILLEIDRANGARLLPQSSAVGRYLSDHLSCAIAHVDPEDVVRAAALFAPAFARQRLRSLRLVDTSRDADGPRHFAHFIFEDADAGFHLAKQVLRALQARKRPEISLTSARRSIAGLVRLAFHRYARSRLYVSPEASVRLQLDVEQQPTADNRIELSPSRDGCGRLKAVVRWRIRDNDVLAIRGLGERILSRWPAEGLGRIRLLSAELDSNTGTKPYDAYHPVGTCRMGEGLETVTDFELKVHGTGNLFVLSTAVLPSAGTANPTFTMLCLGERLAWRLAQTACGSVPA